MAVGGYKGISYPFRINTQGDVTTSTTGKNSSTHIEESIQQILGTKENERVMNPDIYCDIDTLLFEPNDEGLQTLVRNLIAETLANLEERIEIADEEEDIQFQVETEGECEYLYCYITYKVLKYETYYTSKFKLGEAGAS